MCVSLTCIYDLCVSVCITHMWKIRRAFRGQLSSFTMEPRDGTQECQDYMVRAILPTQNIQVCKNYHWLLVVPEISRYSVRN